MKTILCTFLLGMLTFARLGQAQEADGYSAIDWDEASGTVVGYSETDLDDNVQAYYQAEVWANIVDQNGQQLATATRVDRNNVNNGVIGITLDVPGQSNMTYTIHGHHRGMPFYSTGGSCYAKENDLTSQSTTAPRSTNGCGGDLLFDDFYFSSPLEIQN